MRPRKSSVAVAILALLWVPAVAQSNRACLDTKDYVNAVKACSETILTSPNDAAAYHMRGTVLAKNGDTGQAIADYSKAIEINPRFAAAYNSRAEAFVAKGDYERAVADVTKAGELGSQKAQPIKAKVAKVPVRAKPKMSSSASAKTKDKEAKVPFDPFADAASPLMLK